MVFRNLYTTSGICLYLLTFIYKYLCTNTFFGCDIKYKHVQKCICISKFIGNMLVTCIQEYSKSYRTCKQQGLIRMWFLIGKCCLFPVYFPQPSLAQEHFSTSQDWAFPYPVLHLSSCLHTQSFYTRHTDVPVCPGGGLGSIKRCGIQTLRL